MRGINTYRYVVPKEFFENPIKYPNNICYCTSDDIEKCKVDGLLDISQCDRRTFGAPIVMSAPYYYDGDEKLQNKYKPKLALNNDNYGTYVDVEPVFRIFFIFHP